MPRVIPTFDPTAGESGVIKTNAVGNGSVVFTNMSNNDLLLTFPDGSQQFLRAWTEQAYELCIVAGGGTDIQWSLFRAAPGDAPPASYVDGLLYLQGEAVPGHYPVVFPRWVNIGAEIVAAISGQVDANITNPNLPVDASGSTVGIGGAVDVSGSSVNASGSLVSSAITNLMLPMGANATYQQSAAIATNTAHTFTLSVPAGVTALAVVSSALVNSYQLIVVGGPGGNGIVTEGTRPQPVTRIVPLFNNNGPTSYAVTIQNMNGSTTQFDLWFLYGVGSVITNPIEGFTRVQPNLVSTGRAGYQANTAVSGATTRFTVAAAPSGQVLVVDSVFADTAANNTNETAAYIRLQTNDPTPVILFELWSPFAVKPTIYQTLSGPLFFSPGVALNCVTSNASAAAVLQTMNVLYHYQVQ